MKVNNYPLKTPSAGDKLFGSDSNGDQKQFDMSNFGTSTYKVYTALLTQTSTNAPTAVVLDNTIGTIVWTRNSNGNYSGTLTGAFISSKTALFIQDNVTLSSIAVSPADVWIERTDANTVNVYTMNSSNLIDNVLNNTTIEIRVYN